MGTINSNGIFVYDDTESLSPLSSYMNLQGSALSTRLAQDVRFKKVTNEAARTAYVNEVGIANISAANPLAVYRQNATEGLRFEVTYNGSTWDPIPGKSYFDAQNATGTFTPVTGRVETTGMFVRRRGEHVYLDGVLTITAAGATAFGPGGTYGLAVIAAGFAPLLTGVQVTVPAPRGTIGPGYLTLTIAAGSGVVAVRNDSGVATTLATGNQIRTSLNYLAG